MFLAVKLEFEETVEPAALEIIFPMLRDGWNLLFHSIVQASHVLKGHCSQTHATSFASEELHWLVPGQDLTFHQASGVTFYGQQYPETRWDMAEGEQTILKSQKRVHVTRWHKKAPKPSCMPKTPAEIPWRTRLAVKFCQTLHEHFTTLWNNCLNRKLQLFH